MATVAGGPSMSISRIGRSETTMRGVAERAGVSTGNAYYYFKGKEHLLQAYYHRMQEDHTWPGSVNPQERTRASRGDRRPDPQTEKRQRDLHTGPRPPAEWVQ